MLFTPRHDFFSLDAGALKEAKIISGEIGGKNIWAESTSKLDNAEDARKMLEEKLPEIYKAMIKIQLVDEKGNVQQDTKPLARPATIPRARAAETGQKRIPIISFRAD